MTDTRTKKQKFRDCITTICEASSFIAPAAAVIATTVLADRIPSIIATSGFVLYTGVAMRGDWLKKQCSKVGDFVANFAYGPEESPNQKPNESNNLTPL